MRKKIYDIIEIDENGDNLLSGLYDRVMQISILISIIPLMFREKNLCFSIIEFSVTILFTVDYILRWMTADYRSGQKGRKAFIYYPFTVEAIVDFISILPVFSYVNDSFRILRTWRLLRILRIVKFFKYFEPLQIIIDVFKKKSSELLIVVGFAVAYIFLTALLMFNVEQAVNPATGEVFFDNFLDAVYWSTCTLTTVGYGDIYPISYLGRVISMISSLVGIAIIALPSGIITAGYIEEVANRKNH